MLCVCVCVRACESARVNPEMVWRTLVGGALLTSDERRRLTVIFQVLDLGDLTTAPVLEPGARLPFPDEIGAARNRAFAAAASPRSRTRSLWVWLAGATATLTGRGATARGFRTPSRRAHGSQRLPTCRCINDAGVSMLPSARGTCS